MVSRGHDARGSPRSEVGLSRSDRGCRPLPGFGRGGRTRRDVAATEQARHYIAFYGSTPAYADVLRLHGWGGLHDRLQAMSVTADPQRWNRMAALVNDDVVAVFTIIGSLESVCRQVHDRYAGEVDVLNLTVPRATTRDEVAAARGIVDVAAR